MNAPWKPGESDTRAPFLAYACDEAALDTLRLAVPAFDWPVENVCRGGLGDAVQALSASSSPRLLFVDLSDSGDPIDDLNALAEVCEPGTIVIAAGEVNDVHLYRELLARGVHDYLLKPLSSERLHDAFAQARAALDAPRAGGGAEHPHCAVAVIGTRGGAGASTIATSLAWLIGDTGRRATALLDLDVHFGTGALALDLEPGRGLTDAIGDPERIDGLFIERAMVRASEHLSILSAEAPLATPAVSDGTVYHQLQEELRAAFEVSVADLPRTMLVQHPHLVSGMNAVVLVTEMTLAAARDTIRLLAWLRANAPHASVTVIANRVHPGAQPEIARKDFERAIERPIDVAIAFDQKLAVQAAKLGKPLAEAGKGSRTVAPLVAFATTLLPRAAADAPAARKARGGSLLSRFAGLKGLVAKRPGRPK